MEINLDTWFIYGICLLLALFFSYRKDREYKDLPLKGIEIEEAEKDGN